MQRRKRAGNQFLDIEADVDEDEDEEEDEGEEGFLAPMGTCSPARASFPGTDSAT